MSNDRAKAHTGSYFHGIEFVYRAKYVAFLRGVADTSVTGSGSFFRMKFDPYELFDLVELFY